MPDTPATTVRRTTVRIPAAPLGPENPLPALAPRAEPHRLDPRDREGLPADMARQIGYGQLRSVLPVRLRDGYGRDRAPAELDALVIENDAAARHGPARPRRPAALPRAQADRP